MSERRLIIFDCDGTLVDSQHLIVAAMNLAFDAVSMPHPPREAVLGIVGLSLPEAIWQLTGGGEEQVIARIREEYSNAFGVLRQDPTHSEPLYDGALEAVRRLAERDDVVLGIATGKSQRGVRRLLEKFELNDCFKTIQTADDAPSKPHPGMILTALEETNAKPSNTVMIGDTTFDIEMARNADVTALGVSWGYHPVEHLQAGGAHAIADNYPQLMQLLDMDLRHEASAE